MKQTDAVAGPHYQALLQLLRTSETIWNASRVFFARWDLSPSQFNLLNLLSDAPEGFTQIELSRQLIMHRSNVTGLIDRLETRGLLERKPIPEDRRAYRVTLTRAGSRMIEEILPEYYRVAEAIWEDMPAGRTRQFLQELSQLSANVERMERQLNTSK